MANDFEEVAHSGGTITFRIITNAEGQRGYQQSYSSSRPVPLVMIGVYALLNQGLPVSSVNLALGAGRQPEPPPLPGCVMVMIASDSQGKFGHHCPACGGYWRSGPWPNYCPYCRYQDQPFRFLSDAQRRYVAHYCQTLGDALAGGRDGEFVIDMDAVADAAGKEGEKPSFYVSEESQQQKFKCAACNEFNDVIGRYAYCSACATRNEAAVFKDDVVAMRGRVTTDNTGNIVRDAISAFDNIIGQFAKQFHNLVPLSKRRAERLVRGRFHDFDETVDILRWFDINLLASILPSEAAFLKRMFLRRHVYEHHGGEVDAIYLEKSGDTTARLKQHLSESVEDVHRLLGDLDRMVRNLHSGFHELLPPLEAPIKAWAKKEERMKARGNG